MDNTKSTDNLIQRWTFFALLVWGLGITAASFFGFLKVIPPPFVALLVSLGIVIPTMIYFTNDNFRSYIKSLGLKNLTMLHLWRIGAGAMFLFYGAQNLLPQTFVRNAGYGDIAIGLLVFVVLLLPENKTKYWFFHILGMLDFIVAVGTGLTFTLLAVPLMENLVELPIVLIPLYGVGISGATHIFAFDLLWKHKQKLDLNKLETVSKVDSLYAQT